MTGCMYFLVPARPIVTVVDISLVSERRFVGIQVACGKAEFW